MTDSQRILATCRRGEATTLNDIATRASISPMHALAALIELKNTANLKVDPAKPNTGEVRQVVGPTPPMGSSHGVPGVPTWYINITA